LARHNIHSVKKVQYLTRVIDLCYLTKIFFRISSTEQDYMTMNFGPFGTVQRKFLPIRGWVMTSTTLI